jgi:hypothetical protein
MLTWFALRFSIAVADVMAVTERRVKIVEKYILLVPKVLFEDFGTGIYCRM